MRLSWLFVIAGLCIAGCVADKGRTASATPDTAMPRVLSTVASDFVDTDGDRYRDSTEVVVYVFADTGRYPIPMRADGEFDFDLQDASGKSLHHWRFDRDKTRDALRQRAPGPGFVFELKLPKARQIETPEGELVVTFTPSARGSEPIRGKPTAALLIGPKSRSANR